MVVEAHLVNLDALGLDVALANRGFDPALHVRMDVGVHGLTIPPLRREQIDLARQLSRSVVDHIERVWAGPGCLQGVVRLDVVLGKIRILVSPSIAS